MYVGLIAYVSEDINGPNDLLWILVIVGTWNLLLLAATIVAIADSVLRLRGAREPKQLAVEGLVVKLASIPFFLLNFAFLTVLFNASIVLIFIGPILWAIITIGIALTYLTMLSTSVYPWAAITQMRREAVIGTKVAVLYTILSFLFVTDIAVAVLLFGHAKRRPRLALAWLLLGVGIAMIVVGALDYQFHYIDVIFPALGFFHVDWLEWLGPIVIGIAVILATVIVSVVRRPTLRIEAQAARVFEMSTEPSPPA